MKIVSWIVGAFLAILAVGFLSQGNNYFSGILILIAAIIILPITRNTIQTQLQKKDDTFEVTNKKAFISCIVLFIVSTLFMTPVEQQPTIEEKIVEQTSSTQVISKENKPRVYIDEIYKLQQLTEQLVNSTYKQPYSTFERFAIIKKNLERKIEPTCNYFDELVKTTGNYTSPHRDENINCKDTVLSMMVVLFDIRENDHISIEEQRQKVLVINNNLKVKIEQFNKEN